MDAQNINCNIPVKIPKRILHFSDGTLEEYSESEEEQDVPDTSVNTVDTARLTWGPWLFHYIFQTGKLTLSACDYVGESLASLFGITTPKYQYELDEYEKIQKQKQMLEEKNENARGWMKNKETPQ